MKFYTFTQNNSGGTFEISDNIAEYVIIEAENCAHANEIAESIGIYFDGCEEGIDCSCCGDRWYAQWDETDGKDVPKIYGEPVENHKPIHRDTSYVIHYIDGEVKRGEISQ